MRVFLDENIPRQLRLVLDGHSVSFVEREGWKGKENGELLSLLEGRFDVMITADGNLSFQQSLIGRNLSLIVLPTNRLTILRANAMALRASLDEMASYGHHAVIVIDWRGRRTMRRPDQSFEETRLLPPVPPYNR